MWLQKSLTVLGGLRFSWANREVQITQFCVNTFFQHQAGDRLPKVTEKEGLELLRMAWKEYDVAMLLGRYYYLLARVFQLILLLLGVIVIVFTVIYSQRCSEEYDADDCLQLSIGERQIEGIIFILSLAMSLMLALDSYYIPDSRALHLKSGAAELNSIIWLYRTHTRVKICAVVLGGKLPATSLRPAALGFRHAHRPWLGLEITRNLD